MQKQIIFFSVIMAFILNGCSSYSVTKYFEKDELYNKALQYTKKRDISNKTNVIAMFNATYLNSVEDKFNNEYENFVIGIYTANEPEEKQEIILTLNNRTPVVINPLDKKDKLNNIPLKNHWADYYLVSFPKEEVKAFKKQEDKLKLVYTHTSGTSVFVTFLREL